MRLESPESCQSLGGRGQLEDQILPLPQAQLVTSGKTVLSGYPSLFLELGWLLTSLQNLFFSGCCSLLGPLVAIASVNEQ